MNILNTTVCIGTSLLAMLLLSTNGVAREQARQQETTNDENRQEQIKKDKTGTSPINFQRDLRVYSEYSWPNTEGDGIQNVTTVELEFYR